MFGVWTGRAGDRVNRTAGPQAESALNADIPLPGEGGRKGYRIKMGNMEEMEKRNDEALAGLFSDTERLPAAATVQLPTPPPPPTAPF